MDNTADIANNAAIQSLMKSMPMPPKKHHTDLPYQRETDAWSVAPTAFVVNSCVPDWGAHLDYKVALRAARAVAEQAAAKD